MFSRVVSTLGGSRAINGVPTPTLTLSWRMERTMFCLPGREMEGALGCEARRPAGDRGLALAKDGAEHLTPVKHPIKIFYKCH